MIYLVSYGNSLYNKALERIVKQAREFGRFNSAFIYQPHQIKPPNKDFDRVFHLGRGGGYWIWKPYIIKKSLELIKENNILVYCDAGCLINKDGINRFDEYIDLLKGKPLLIFQHKNWIEMEWCNHATLEYFNVKNDLEITETPQFAAGIIMIRKTIESVEFIDKWYKVAEEKPELFSDELNHIGKIKEFRDHRHDQSILSIITKQNLEIVNILEDEIDLITEEKKKEVPFIAARSKK